MDQPADPLWEDLCRRLKGYCAFVTRKRHSPRDTAEDRYQEGITAALQSDADALEHAKEAASKMKFPAHAAIAPDLEDTRPANPGTPTTDVFAIWRCLLRASPAELKALPNILAKEHRNITKDDTERQYRHRIHRRTFLRTTAAGFGALFLPTSTPHRGYEDPFIDRKLDRILDAFQTFRLHGPLKLITLLFDPVIDNAKEWLGKYTPKNDAVANTFMRLFDFRHLVAQDMMMQPDFQQSGMRTILASHTLSDQKEKEWTLRLHQDDCREAFHQEQFDETLKRRKKLDASDLPSLFFRNFPNDLNAVTVAFETGSFLASARDAAYVKWFQAAYERADPTLKGRIGLQLLKRQLEFRPDSELAWQNYQAMEALTTDQPEVVASPLYKTQSNLCKLFALLLVPEKEPEATAVYHDLRSEIALTNHFQGERRLDQCFRKAISKGSMMAATMYQEYKASLPA